MLFHTYQFVLAFAPLSLAIFYSLRALHLPRLALLSIVLLSLVFYGYWRADYVPYLVASIAVNFAVGSIILNTSKDAVRRTFMLVGVAGNLIFLGFFKYAAFAVEQTNALFGSTWSIPKILLPLAVSFYTFQQIAYVVDCYRRKIHDNDWLKYAFTVTFFPHLIAGPIVRMREIVHQFDGIANKAISTNLAVGLTLFVVGLSKKLLIADWFGGIADPLFASAHQATAIDFASAWIAALAYTLQLYFDFSGYSDMAIGLARMFGIRLAINFLSPYQAANIAEFWRRWHITLSRFLRDYLYIPLGGNRTGSARTYLNLIITMTLGGLWHGASWTFVAWGAYHGVLLSAHRLWRSWRPNRIPRRSFGASALTFFAIVIGWVIFRSPDFATAAKLLRGMASLHVLSLDNVLAHDLRVYVYLALGLGICWLMPNAYQFLFKSRPALLLREQIKLVRWRTALYSFHFTNVEAAAISALLAFNLYQMRGTVTQFLYFMF